MDGVSAAQSLVSNVAQLLGDEFWQLRNMGGEVTRLRNELATINALLRMQSEADKDGVDHFVREWMNQLREVGYDAEDCVHLYLFRVRSQPGDGFLVRWKHLLTTCWSRHCLAGDIRDLRAQASAINEQHARYGFSLEPLRQRDAASSSLGPAAVSARPPLDPSADSYYSHRHQFVDNKDLAVDLANKVKALGNDDDKKLKVFSIWGFGGLGKTTLALEVCRLLETEFPCQTRVSVSQTFSSKDLQGLLKRLLRQIGLPKLSSVKKQQEDHSSKKESSPSPGMQGDTMDHDLPEQETVNKVQEADPLGNIDTMDVGQLENKIKESLENRRLKG